MLAIAALVAGTIAVRTQAAPAYVTQPVLQQDLTQSVTASGTVNPQNIVSVGTQASGTISAIYVDYNSRVKRGEILARIDPTQMQAQLDQATATLAQAQAQAGAQAQNASGAVSGVTVAQAGIETAQANVVKSQSALAVANLTVARDKALLSKGYIAQSQYDTDESTAVGAQSALEAAQAAAVQAKAQTAQTSQQASGSQYTAAAQEAAVQIAQAQVAQAQYTLDHSVITSPVDGTVVARNVSVGQTVAASFQTPTLFTIAQNLQKMEVDISVGEPDIGNVRVGDAVGFSVLAYPNQTFQGKVSQVRVNPTTINNVVTYDVVCLVDNPRGQLLPGMTANASIGVATVRNALVVPAQALAWRPARASHTTRNSATSPWGQTGSGVAGSVTPGADGVVFVERAGRPHAVRVRIDLTSGTLVAVTPLRGTLAAGDAVVISDASATSARSTRGAASPIGGNSMGIGRAIH